MHFDVRSDNVCFVEGARGASVKMVDWNWAGRGNALLDRAAWLPSLHAEGGPPPWALLPDSQGLSALLSGYFAASAGLPPGGSGPRGRALQLTQLRSALPWAARELGLERPDGRCFLRSP